MAGRSLSSAAATQMIVVPISANAEIENQSSPEGRAWSRALDIIEQYPGFQRLYWGRHLEETDKTQVHVVRDTIHQHYTFLASEEWKSFQETVSENIKTTHEPLNVRHAMLYENTLGCESLGKGAPVSGTAIYIGTTKGAWDAAWTLWSTIISQVPGNLGVAGGYMVEPVDGYKQNFIVFVGWENPEVHDHYHHTADYRKKGIILRQANQGFREYGHVVFAHSRSKPSEKL